eukprot:CAMPEP_0201485748 /NCGR_PEP_ID=MMETSP0151_2-20130828/9854_1 /ASSEMBLY_ACC=CAM_ASM_000257 /TAXON_ID=200890 /ORGANISM="Paramoeba atlantica, Strain 621/1 / CCAP 1560/9" /LENGTH=488 /DNA_ID=CAMNT_0047870045 /DNA_START=39 /DNA_END=1505 /DNA_ORIENTATION=+
MRLLGFLLCVGIVYATVTPLTYYVKRDDGYFAWNVSSTVHQEEGYKFYNIFLTAGLWLTPTDSSTYVQTHWLQMCVPDNLEDPSVAYMYMDGGHNHPFTSPPSELDFTIYIPCLESNSISLGLYQIPNAPVVFQGDPSQKSRSEDAIIAWTWAHYFNNTLEPDWLARMPMTKAGVLAMDAAQQYWDTIRGALPPLDSFIVAGASKRGWTAWMVGAMGDPRVVAIVPVVAPVANLVPQLNEQWQSYGNWTWALADYYQMGLMGFLNLPVFQQMLDIIDPLTYREEMAKIPKYQIGATNDEFFMPDSLKWYWDDLPGPKLWRAIPNSEHSMIGHAKDLLRSMTTYLLSFKKGYNITLPVYEWSISEDHRTITVSATTEGLTKVRVWKSENMRHRDWRAIRCVDIRPDCSNPLAVYVPDTATQVAEGVYEYTIAEAKEGRWSAFFLELEYTLLDGYDPMYVTSDITISPLTLPYLPCPNTTCACGWNCSNF